MSKYRVLINGQNFLLDFDGRTQKLGFYVTRVVAADNAEEAESLAMSLVRKDSRLKGNLLNHTLALDDVATEALHADEAFILLDEACAEFKRAPVPVAILQSAPQLYWRS